MLRENKKMFLYIGLLFLAVLITHKIPHSSYSIISYIIRPITSKFGTIELSGLVPLILFFIATEGLFRLKRFESQSKIMLFVVIIIMISLMSKTLHVARTGYHWAVNDGLNSIEIVDASYSMQGSSEKVSIRIKLKLKDYGTKQNEFKVRMYLPDTAMKYIGKDILEFDKVYKTNGFQKTFVLEEELLLDNNDPESYKWFSTTNYRHRDYEVYNETQSIRLMNSN